MNKFFSSLCVATLLFSSAVAVSAADYQFYVRNRPFTEAVVTGTSVSAPLDTLLDSLGYSWRVDGANILVYQRKGSGPRIRGGVYKLMLNDVDSCVPLTVKNDRVYVNVETFALAFKLSYRVSEALETIDLGIPVSKSAVAANYPASKASSSQSVRSGKEDKKDNQGVTETQGDQNATHFKQKANKGGMVETKFSTADGSSFTPKEQTGSPVLVNSVNWFRNEAGIDFPAEVRVSSATFSNSSASDVEDVKVDINAVLFDGTVMYTWSKDIGKMTAGQSKTVEFEDFFRNDNHTPITLEVVVTHKPQVDKEAEAKAKAAKAAGASKSEVKGETSAPVEEK
ncbi:hypothetical protein IJT10_00755 [bacterium]|nr:hypothetical protein [bacterium]